MPAWLTTSDWIFYTLSAILALAGAWLLHRALFKDRSRGKRRCPKCWYDLTGIPANVAPTRSDPVEAAGSEANAWTCPECGRITLREGQMLRTRRHWVPCFAGVIALALSYAAFKTPVVLKSDWTRFVPTTILIVVADADPLVGNPNANTPGNRVGLSSTGRVNLAASAMFGTAPAQPPPPTWRERLSVNMWGQVQNESAYDWQIRYFVRRALATQKIGFASLFETPPSWIAGRPLAVTAADSSFQSSPLGPVLRWIPTLELEVKNDGGQWVPVFRKSGFAFVRETVRTPPANGAGRTSFEFRLTLPRNPSGEPIVIEEERVNRPIRIVTSTDEVLTPVDTPAMNQEVRTIRWPRLLLNASGLTFIVNDRIDSPVWNRISFFGALDYTIRSGDQVLGSGKADSWSFYPVWRDWQESAVQWKPGGEAIALSGAPLEVDVRGNTSASFDYYASDPFSYQIHSAWAGEFTCPLPIVDSPQPSAVDPIDPRRAH